MEAKALSPGPSVFRLISITPTASAIVLNLIPLNSSARCPVCSTLSSRIHSRYLRSPMDLPWSQWPVRLMITARRFFCDNPDCPQRIFAEPFPGIISRYSRRTDRLQNALLELSHIGSAESAARLASLLGFVASGDTLIREQRKESIKPSLPETIGVDEFSLKRGETYSTIIVDLEHHRPLDVLEGRQMEVLSAWLEKYAGIKVIARDRAEAYASAAKKSAPDAVQVADRFHLLRNAGDALRKLIDSRRWVMTKPEIKIPPSEMIENIPAMPVKLHQASPRKVARWEEVRKRRAAGISIRAIASDLKVSRRTIRKYLSINSPPIYGPKRPLRNKITPFLPYLKKRWEEGCHKASYLYREIVKLGYDGSDSRVRMVVHPWRKTGISVLPKHPPSLIWLLLRSKEKLRPEEREDLEETLRLNPLLEIGYKLKEDFGNIVRQRNINGLEDWLNKAVSSGIKSFTGMAKSIRQDIAAVINGLELKWSTAQCEGQNCRVKLIKRAGYGRAKVDLLRQRILHRAPAL